MIQCFPQIFPLMDLEPQRHGHLKLVCTRDTVQVVPSILVLTQVEELPSLTWHLAMTFVWCVNKQLKEPWRLETKQLKITAQSFTRLAHLHLTIAHGRLQDKPNWLSQIKNLKIAFLWHRNRKLAPIKDIKPHRIHLSRQHHKFGSSIHLV